jgi:predicted MPP superfamily phosphohydrolase
LRLGWLSDIHLNFLDAAALAMFLGELASHAVDGWLIGGDIAEADSVGPLLEKLAAEVPGRVYFVLGNHDFYGSSFAAVRRTAAGLSAASPRLVHLTAVGPVTLSPAVALVGDDSWADARLGDPRGSRVEISDFYLIEDLAGLSRDERIRICNRLGDEAAARIASKLEEAAQSRSQVVVLTHPPPFREAAWYGGKPSTDEWLPWFSCRAVGTAILECAERYPRCDFLVLCGHTHGSGEAELAPNVTALTAEAAYGSPRIQRFLDFASA